MNLSDVLAQHQYRPVISIDFEPEGAMMNLMVTFSSEAGRWRFQAPREVQKPFFVVSLQLGQTLVSTREGDFVGRTSPEVIRALKAERHPSFRHIVDAKKESPTT